MTPEISAFLDQELSIASRKANFMVRTQGYTDEQALTFIANMMAGKSYPVARYMEAELTTQETP